MKKKDYVPPEVIVVHLQFESHILPEPVPRLESTSLLTNLWVLPLNKTFLAASKSPSAGERRTYGIEPFARFNF